LIFAVLELVLFSHDIILHYEVWVPNLDNGFRVQDFEFNQADVLVHVNVSTCWLLVLELNHVTLDLKGKEKGEEVIDATFQCSLGNKLENDPGVQRATNCFLCFFKHLLCINIIWNLRWYVA